MPSPPESEPASPPPKLIGRFVVRSRVGAGAFGTVYRAFDPQLEREVALKVPQRSTLESPKAAERFLREAKAAARLRHPHIVPVFEAAQDGDCPYIASAFIEGRTLAEVLDVQALDVRHAVQVVHDLADALAYAHEQGVVHRDVKPANVMLDEKGRALLMDFGLAQQHDDASQFSKVGAVLGTPSYMSPEQAQGQYGPAMPASDQYSLGVVLYELLCGQTPFTGPTNVVLFNVINTEPVPPSGVRASVPPELEAICLKAMAKRPEGRFPGMTDFAAALAGYLWSASGTAPTIVVDSPARVFSNLTTESETMELPRRRSRSRMAIFGGAMATLLTVAIVAFFMLRPQYGNVRLELSDSKADVTLKLDGRELAAAEWAKPQRLPVGKRELEITGKTIEPVKQMLDVIRGENEPVRIELKPKVVVPNKVDPRSVVPPKPPDPVKYPPPIDADKMITNSIGMKLAFIPKGKFLMGGGGGKAGEKEVEIPYDFHMGIYEVTQGEWKAVLKEPNPSQFSRTGTRKAAVSANSDAELERFPVESVTWDDAQRFLVALNAKEKKASWKYRLPKEAEWEYACRGGPLSKPGEHDFDFFVGEPTNQLSVKQANFEAGGAGLGRTCRVGDYPPNRRGLFDMHGNVWEWCDEAQDSYGKPGHASRGGGYQDSARKASFPHPLWETFKDQNLGFRVALVPVKPADVAWSVADIRESRILAPDLSKAKKLFEDTFTDMKSGFEHNIGKDGDREAYIGGKYVITNPARAARRSHFFRDFPVGEGAYEVRGRLRSGPTDEWGLQLNNYSQKLGISVRIRNNGWVSVSPGAVDAVKEGLSGPTLAALAHPALKKNGEWNTLLLILRNGTAEVYVNGLAVAGPIALDPTFESKRLQFVLSTLDAGEAELERITVYATDGLPALAPTATP